MPDDEAKPDEAKPDDDLDELGPIDYLVIEFPGTKLNGEGLPLLVDLVDRRVVRVLDLLFVKKLMDGSMTMLTMRELLADGGRGLGIFSGASSGVIGGDDLDAVAEVLEPGSSAAVVLYENLWAAPLASALRRAGAQFVAGGRIPVDALAASLDLAENDFVKNGTSPDAQPQGKG
jgi:hypothetical protein